MKSALSKRIMRWFFIMLMGLFIALASYLPVDAVKIAFQSNRDFADFEFKYNIYAMDANGKNLVKLTKGPASDLNPAWSPDGTEIAFASSRKGNLGIYVMDADGGNPMNLTQNPNGGDWSPGWSPDGSRIVFNSRRDGNEEIYVVNANGANPINLTQHLKSDRSPSWSPDGTQIAFSSDRDGDYEIYVMNADGSNPIQLTEDPWASDQGPSWSPGWDVKSPFQFGS